MQERSTGVLTFWRGIGIVVTMGALELLAEGVLALFLSPAAAQWAAQVLLAPAALVAAVWLVNRESFSRTEPLLRWPRWQVTVGALLTFVGANVLFTEVHEFAASLPQLEPVYEYLRGLVEGLYHGFTWPMMLSTVTAAGPYEETLFRGILLTGWSATMGPRRALWASSLVFAIGHPFPSQLVMALVLGLGLGYLLLRTGSLYLVALLHAFYNFLAVVILNLSGIVPVTDGPWTWTTIPLWFDLLGVLLLVVGGLMLKRYLLEGDDASHTLGKEGQVKDLTV